MPFCDSEKAEELIDDLMGLAREELHILYRDSIIKKLSTNIDNYKKTDIIQPEADVILDEDKVILVGNVEIIVKNVGDCKDHSFIRPAKPAYLLMHRYSGAEIFSQFSLDIENKTGNGIVFCCGTDAEIPLLDMERGI